MAIYKLDPEGDVLLTLRNPNAPFAVWDSDCESRFPHRSKPNLEPEPESGPEFEFDPESVSEPEPEPEPKRKPEPRSLIPAENNYTSSLNSSSSVQFLVSSRHLILASGYFRGVLRGPWKEGTVIHPDGRRHVSAEDWDETALLIVMQAIHGRNRNMPASITLDLEAKIAVLVDYYKCHEALMPWWVPWDKSPKPRFSPPFGRNLVLWILISSVTEQEEELEWAMRVAVRHSENSFPTMGLPIADIAEKIDQRRLDYLNQIFDYLYNTLANPNAENVGCDSSCSSVLIGALTTQMQEAGLGLKPESPFIGYSIASLIKRITEFKTPESKNKRCSCRLNGLLFDHLSEMESLDIEEP
ncbi:uncharacterized protein GGS22DRAFT_172801 [Annulohypoxylon maeteangense]|uniref:uncharacterized protein n=1 Tax=Annulohypoxylon maeteangense TaxID=1927788 RepID=UPI0020088AA6|nr:uncharacterized protein GGS22DRAFT_172801 [Annulohypoxylon maeteangense]KAI0881275.1 hypothetical protein GGS22DRAFT_172801 [Annulohypoxylon maeteangense]